MVLAELFALDPDAVMTYYAGADDFHRQTMGRFHTLTADQQHGRGGHRWNFAGVPRTFECACGAQMTR